MIKKTLCIALLVGCIAAVTVAAFHSRNTHSLLLEHINRPTPDPTELPAPPRDTLAADSLQVVTEG
ncbi:MAG: hypothetical protein IJX65_00295 [Alistipes sp.]|nr:hypothetical protein [Alistipes sp.]